MRKIMGTALLAVMALLLLAACASAGNAPAASADNGQPLGDSGVRVSGSLEAGGSTVVR